MSLTAYVAHLASDTSPLETACGEPWQGWQEPFDADMVQPSDRYAVAAGPSHLQPPRPHQDTVRQCGACLRLVLAGP